MRNIKFIPVILFITLQIQACGQNKNVPEAVKEKFTSLYPNVNDAKWEKEGSAYEAEFNMNKEKMTVVISKTGDLLETEKEMNTSLLPAAIPSYVSSEMPGYEIDEAEELSRGGKIFYEVEAKKGKEETEILFDSTGNFVRLDNEEEENDKGDDEDE